MKSKTKKVFGIVLLLAVLLVSYFAWAILVFPPEVKDKSALNLPRVKIDTDFYKAGDSWLKKSETGLWELYVEGKPFERGVKAGKLAEELSGFQEEAFISQIQTIVPSQLKLHLLRFFVAWYNRDLENNVTEEYQEEIYGVSSFASDKFDFIGPKYQRMLYYHAAHDIGHALQDKRMVVGCTSFAARNEKSEDGHLIIGRNFDFYVGDDFAKNKIVEFVKPQSGNKFMMVTWGGMIGAVSGMNEFGLTVSINASKADIPAGAATPVSLLAREILQYARNTSEAYAIASKRKTFVAESILVGSDAENKAVIIEKAPSTMDLYSTDEDYIVCPNHYQGTAFIQDKNNLENIAENSSYYRLQKMKQLLDVSGKINPAKAAEILRDQKGLNGKNIGMTNEKNINALIAHHSVIFKPHDRLVWISTGPFQSGAYVCYDLKKVFNEYAGLSVKKEIVEKDLTIPADPFMQSAEYINYLHFSSLKKLITDKTEQEHGSLPPDSIRVFIGTNPECYTSYRVAGDYFSSRKDFETAIRYYAIGLNKEIATGRERHQMRECLVHANLELMKLKGNNEHSPDRITINREN